MLWVGGTETALCALFRFAVMTRPRIIRVSRITAAPAAPMNNQRSCLRDKAKARDGFKYADKKLIFTKLQLTGQKLFMTVINIK